MGQNRSDFGQNCRISDRTVEFQTYVRKPIVPISDRFLGNLKAQTFEIQICKSFDFGAFLISDIRHSSVNVNTLGLSFITNLSGNRLLFCCNGEELNQKSPSLLRHADKVHIFDQVLPKFTRINGVGIEQRQVVDGPWSG